MKNTLEKLVDFGLGDMRILIADDASDQPCPFEVTSICPRAELKRFAEVKGATARRNQMAREMDAKYYLGLDDDSFPVSGSLEAAIQFAEICPNFFSTSFPIYNPYSKKHQVQSLQKDPYRVQTFVGAGHLMDREKFLALGGYREELVYYIEEPELCTRAFSKGLYCYHFSGLQINHLSSSSGRNWHRQAYYGARNTVLWYDWVLPPQLKLVKQSRNFLARVLQIPQIRSVSQIRGYYDGLRDIPRYKAYRQPMPIALYNEWKSLPTS